MEYGRKKINFYVAPITGTPQIAQKKMHKTIKILDRGPSPDVFFSTPQSWLRGVRIEFVQT